MNPIIFILVLLITTYPIGWLSLKYSSELRDHAVLLVTIGLLIFGIEGYLLGYLNLSALFPVFIAVQSFILWTILILSIRVGFPKVNLVPGSLVVVIVTLFSVYINSQLTFPFGKITPSGISLPEGHFVDSTWHLSLINNLNSKLPPQNPIYSKTPLTNYHYLTDLIIAKFGQLTKIPTSQLYFQFFGPLFALLLASNVYTFALLITRSRWAGILSVLLSTLSSNLYYLIPYFYHAARMQPSVAWIDLFSTKGINYQVSFSLSLLTVCLILVNSNSKYLLGLIVGITTAIKTHTALPLTASLLVLAPFYRRTWITSAIIAILITTLFVLILTTGAPAFVFSPLWYIKVMFESPDHLNNPDWELKRQFLLSVRSYLGVFKLYSQGLIIFFIINFGPLLLSVVEIIRNKLSVVRLMATTSFLGIMVMLSFIYTKTAIVSLGFIYPALFIFSILTALLISSFHSKHPFYSITLGIIIWITLLPGVTYTSRQFISQEHVYSVDVSTIRLIDFLNSEPMGVVATDQSFWSGSIIPGYTHQSLYVGDDLILPGLGIDTNQRRKNVSSVLDCIVSAKEFNIDYLVTTKSNQCLRTQMGLVPAFVDGKMIVYRVL